MRFVLMALGEEAETAATRPELDRYRAELVRAGVLLAADALEPASAGVSVRCTGEERILSRPATSTVSALWMVETAGEDEALEWARRLPLTSGTVEVRRVAGDDGR
ncbi:YciI family protein [Leifsonia poae]|uniref:YciI family protein n=1 Tax=Leifsonia poae TaxID=110933 RepID=UPI003D68667D